MVNENEIKYFSTKKEMLNIKGITEQKAEKIYEAASKIETMSF